MERALMHVKAWAGSFDPDEEGAVDLMRDIVCECERGLED
jgi:hypothetical protein